jgi:hypothetical protein
MHAGQRRIRLAALTTLKIRPSKNFPTLTFPL